MTHKLQIRRYAAYIKGWCQAYGEHEGLFTEDESISWLYTDEQTGLILPAGLGKKLYSSEHIPMISNGHGIHVKALCLVQHLFDPNCAVKEAEFRMNVQMYKRSIIGHNNLYFKSIIWEYLLPVVNGSQQQYSLWIK